MPVAYSLVESTVLIASGTMYWCVTLATGHNDCLHNSEADCSFFFFKSYLVYSTVSAVGSVCHINKIAGVVN